MTFIPSHIIEDAITLIMNTRDFCGNEAEAIREFASENGLKSEWKKIHGIANFRANKRWNDCKRQAGVKEKHIF